jgi:hypothetical protein
MSNLNLGECTSNTSSITLNRLKNCELENEMSQDISTMGSVKRSQNFINKSFLPIKISNISKTTSSLSDLNTTPIPENWSWLKKGGNKIEDGRRDQKNCGCCWAFSVISVLGDRYALTYNIEAPYPSVANLVSCGGPWVGSKSLEGNFVVAKDQCNCGGVTFGGSEWLESNSVVSENCWPFSTISSHKYMDSKGNVINIAPNCIDNLGNGCCAVSNGICCKKDPSPKFSVKPNSTTHILKYENNKPLLNETINAIKLEIMSGPVSTTIFVPPNFQDWWNKNNNYTTQLLTEDIFIPNGPPTEAGHAIVLTGWGKKNGINYWEIRNSWGLSAYAYVAMSTEYSSEYHFGIDIPIIPPGEDVNKIFSIEQYSGGVISFQPGSLDPLIKKGTGKGDIPVLVSSSHKSSKKPDTYLLTVIGIIFIICVILYVVI